MLQVIQQSAETLYAGLAKSKGHCMLLWDAPWNRNRQTLCKICMLTMVC